MSNENIEVNETINPISTEVQQVESNQESPIAYVTFDELKSKFTQDTKINDILTIKKYLPIIHKRILVDNIISSVKDYTDNGMVKINYINLELYKHVYMLEMLSNYAFTPDTMIEEIDYMLENGIMTSFHYELGSQLLWDIDGLIEKEIDQMLKVENSMESIINTHLYLFQDKLDLLINKIPDFKEDTVNKWIKSLSKTLKNINPDQFSKVQEMMHFAKGTGK